MRAIPASSLSHLLPQPPATSSSSSSSYSSSNSISLIHSSLLFSHPFHFNTHRFSLYTPPSPKSFPPFLYRASKSDPTTLDDDDDSGNLLVAEDDGIESLAEDGVYIVVMKREKNSRRIEARISIDAPLDAVWRLLTVYDGLADFIPGLLTSKLVEKGDNFARLLQVAEQSLAFGIKFDAKGVIDCFEKDLETLPSGMKRDIEFKMVKEILNSLKENGLFCSCSVAEVVRRLNAEKLRRLSRTLWMLSRSRGFLLSHRGQTSE